MAISNNTLMVLVVGVLALSVLGTTFSLKMLNEGAGPTTTGFASSDQGTVNLLISQTASLVLDDDTIDFGTCSVDTVSSFSYYNGSEGPLGSNNSLCSNNATMPDNMTIRNDGTIGIAVTMNASINGSDLFDSGSSKWYYSITDISGGCNGTAQTAWTAVDDPLIDLAVCDWLQTYSQNGDSASTVAFDFAAHVALGGYNEGTPLTLTFEATAK